MKKFIALAFAAVAYSAQAATVYQDRPYPVSGAPCFVSFNGKQLNAGIIYKIDVEPREWADFSGAFGGYKKQPPYLSLRATFVNLGYEEVRGDKTDLQRMEAELMKAIKACNK